MILFKIVSKPVDEEWKEDRAGQEVLYDGKLWRIGGVTQSGQDGACVIHLRLENLFRVSLDGHWQNVEPKGGE